MIPNEAQLGSFLDPQTDPHSSENKLESLKTGQMMDESDDDFKELCASFFQRVKKNGTKEVSGERKTKKSSNITQLTSKPTATKSKTLQGPRERKTRSGSQATRTKKRGVPKWQESEPAPSENGEGSALASAMLWRSAWSTRTGNPVRNIARTSIEETRGDLYYFKPRGGKFSVKGHIVNFFGFAGRMVSVNSPTP